MTYRLTTTDLAQLLPTPEGKHFVTGMQHGTMSVELYRPDRIDLQTPHRQDELYVVVSGSGTFFVAGERMTFQTGDLLFVPAGAEHRFEDFTEDFATWVIFYGPEGGERTEFYF